jgi:hypothetical protein
MIPVIRTELYRIRTVRSSWLALVAAAVLCTAAGVVRTGMWSFLVGAIAFLLGVVGAAQHYQHRTAVLLFLARPRRLTVLSGQLLAHATVAVVFAAVTGVAALIRGELRGYLITIGATALITMFAVANAVILRKPVWVIIGYGLWFLFVEGLVGQFHLPGPFSGYLIGTLKDPWWVGVLAFWSVLATLVAAHSVNRDLTGD